MDFSTQAIPRIDPRRPWVLGPSGLKRIVLGDDSGSRDAAMLAGPAHKPLREAVQPAPAGGGPCRTRPAGRCRAKPLPPPPFWRGKDGEVLALLYGMEDAAPEALAELAVDRA
jgi:electron transfer flavoprotein alpha subunit